MTWLEPLLAFHGDPAIKEKYLAREKMVWEKGQPALLSGIYCRVVEITNNGATVIVLYDNGNGTQVVSLALSEPTQDQLKIMQSAPKCEQAKILDNYWSNRQKLRQLMGELP